MYNVLVFLVGIMPGGNIGWAVIVLTILVKLLLFPLSQRGVETQAKMREIEPEIRKIKERHKDNQQEQALKTMELYKKHNVNPFSGCLLLLIQLPIIFALYYVFLKGVKFDGSVLYSFVSLPHTVNLYFFGLDLAQKSLFLAVLAGVTQYFQLKLAIPPLPPKTTEGKISVQDELARNMSLQMKYVFPVMVFFIAYSISSVIALYWIVSNVFAVGQELYVRRKKHLKL
jgi:YidC/Oxa1 family membrane protein insertase